MIGLATLFQIAALTACGTAPMPERIACLVPEYGGFFYDSAKVLNVILSDTARAAEIRPLLRTAFRVSGSQDLKLRKGKYTYRELDGFLKLLSPVMSEGIAMVSIGGRRNRVDIVYVTSLARDSIWKRVHDLGLPADAFGLERGDYFQVR
jgi:hypothetical protein